MNWGRLKGQSLVNYSGTDPEETHQFVLPAYQPGGRRSLASVTSLATHVLFPDAQAWKLSLSGPPRGVVSILRRMGGVLDTGLGK